MVLEAGDAKESLDYGGSRYYFCSAGCRAEFQRHPEDYAGGARADGGAKK